MKKCLFCEKELTSDIGYITDGKISVCMLCAGRYTFNEVFLRVASDSVDSNIQRVFVPAFEVDETGLTGQTDYSESAIDGDVLASDDDMSVVQEDIENLSEEDFMSKYTDNPAAIDSYMEFHKLGVYADEPDESDE